jgi:prepilin-type N-terminal cleavage/methylation domain-containing protein
MSIFSPRYRSSNIAKAGFTLIELMVVMAIMAIVTGVMLVNQSKFDSSTILRSLAYSVALSVRQAQVYGTSVLGTSTPQAACNGFYASGVCYASAYGLYFTTGSPGQYILFADINSNGKYDVGEDAKVFSLGTGYSISQFCVTGTNVGNPVTQCSNTTISSLSIVFKRPNPDAFFTALDGSGNPIAGDTYTGATIQIQNQGSSGNTHTISVTSTGLISVQ